MVRSAAVRAVAKTLPASEAVAVLRPVLTGSSASLQRRTAEALASVGPEGCSVLKAHAAGLDGEARAPLAQALVRCSGTPSP